MDTFPGSPEQALDEMGAKVHLFRPRSEAQGPRTFGRLRLLGVRDALNAPARTYLLDGLMAPGELSVWWGRPKCGKSFLLLRIAYGLALGERMWGREVPERCPALYLAAEGGGGFGHRVAALAREMGEAEDFLFVPQAIDLFDANADLPAIVEAVKVTGSRLVVVDTLARVMAGGDEDKAAAMGVLVRNLDVIRQETGAHVAVVHHGAKGNSDGPRGSGALLGAADLVVAVSASDGEHRAEVTDAKDDPSGSTLAFRLRLVELPPDPSGRPRSTCIAEDMEGGVAPRPARTKDLTEIQRGWFNDLRDMFAEPGFPATKAPKAGMAPVPTLTRDQIRAGYRVRGRFDSDPHGGLTAADRGRLRDMLNAMSFKGKIAMYGELVWLL
ncbi:AAA family ATPase [Roseomonas mucosa]|uniref:AAA family ATPase n=1 Tax=Roseomonas mucosa TaxID=207340 RepID=UPI0030D5ADD8